MATTLEMVIRTKYLTTGAGTLEAELKNIKRVMSDLRKSDMTVDISRFLPTPGDLKGVENALAAVNKRLVETKEAQAAAFGQGQKGAGIAIQDQIRDLENYKKQSLELSSH